MVLNQNILPLFSSVSLGAALLGPIIDASSVRIGSISIDWTGTPVGSFSLAVSNEITAAGALPSDASFDTIEGSTVAVSTDSQQTWIFTEEYYVKWMRIVWTYTSGTGTVTRASIATKQES